MRLDRRRLTIALALEDDLVEVVDGVEVKIVQVTGAGFDVTRYGDVAGNIGLCLRALSALAICCVVTTGSVAAVDVIRMSASGSVPSISDKGRAKPPN